MSLHSAGPWELEDVDGIEPAVMSGDYYVATIHHLGPKNRAEHHFNAALIAAAPDLLGAVKLALAEHGKSVLFGSEALSAMEMAIAKAEGRP